MKVPVFGWPPMFVNQMVKAFVHFDTDGTILAKSPNVVSVTWNGAGDYSIVLERGIPGAPIINAYTTDRTIQIGATDAPVFANWDVDTVDNAGAAADSECSVYFCQTPASWVV